MLNNECQVSLETQESLFEDYKIIVDSNQKDYRIDKFLVNRLPNITRSKIQLAIKHHLVLVNEKPTKPSYQVRPYDEIKVTLPTPPHSQELLAEPIPLNIVYEDDALLVINKPAGMVVHPGYNNWTGTLVNALLYHFENLPSSASNEGRPGLTHRLDKGTSGLLVIAKTEASLIALAKQFHDHSIERSYYALVWGEPAFESGTIDINLDRSLKDRRIVTAYADPNRGKKAITHYQIIKKMGYVSLIKCKLETGRTHQIRAHMKYIGHPIFGDAVYGGDRIIKEAPLAKYKTFVQNCFQLMPRQALHAYSLGFVHPITNQLVRFEKRIPDDFQAVLDKWVQYIHSY